MIVRSTDVLGACAAAAVRCAHSSTSPRRQARDYALTGHKTRREERRWGEKQSFPLSKLCPGMALL